ncbi:MAG: LamG domain-containing protein, partial [candidate division KSB1 bacterium]|nr:LamG domain-containing protein [candidate division KSB1 bacterium]
MGDQQVLSDQLRKLAAMAEGDQANRGESAGDNFVALWPPLAWQLRFVRQNPVNINVRRVNMKRHHIIVAAIIIAALGFGSKVVLAQNPPMNGLVAYYPFNGNANDESGNGNHGTVHGATLIEDRFNNHNSAYFFDGNGSYIDCGNGPSLQISGDITVCVWTKLQATTHGQVIVNKYLLSHGKGWLIETYPTGQALFNVRPGPEALYTSGGSGNVFDNNWHFLVGQRSGTKIKIFFDGILNSEYNTNSSSSMANSVNMMIGVQSDRPFDPAAFAKGIIDDIRIYNRVLTESEIRALYNENGLVAYYPFNGNANDESGNGNNGMVSGCTLTQDRFGNQNKAYMFNGSNNLINCGHGPSLQLTNSLTLSAWFKPASSKLGEYIISKSDHNTPGYEYLICFDYCQGVTGWGLKTAVGGIDYDEVGSNWTPQDNQWHHVVVTFSYPGQLRLYLDGNLLNSKNSTGNIEPTTQDVIIGCIRPSGEPSMRYFDGALDDIRIYNRALSDAEIQALYQEGPLAAPVLLSPANGATGISATPTLHWNAVTGATSYKLQVSSDSTFSAPVVNQSGLTSTSYSGARLVNNTTYYWRVKAVNASGESAWSSVWRFTTKAAPIYVNVTSPQLAGSEFWVYVKIGDKPDSVANLFGLSF